MQRVYRGAVLLSLLGALFISGCDAAPQPTRSPLQVASAPAVSPLATPTVVVQPAALTIERPGTATVGGRLLRTNNTPIKHITVYAAAIDESTGAKLASVDPAVNPRTETDANGYFSFSGLQPGEYALVVSTPNGLILPETSASQSVVFTGKADQVTDMGLVLIGYEYSDN